MKGPDLTLEEAVAKGLTLDCSCYPNVAYSGPRFSPTEWHYVESCRERELKHFNNLSPAEAERLTMLIAAANSVIAQATSVLLHGFERGDNIEDPLNNPDMTNRQRLERELGNFQSCMTSLAFNSDVESTAIREASHHGLQSVFDYSHHQEKLEL